MQFKSFVLAAALAGAVGWAGPAAAQFGPPYGVAYPGAGPGFDGMVGGPMGAMGGMGPMGGPMGPMGPGGPMGIAPIGAQGPAPGMPPGCAMAPGCGIDPNCAADPSGMGCYGGEACGCGCCDGWCHHINIFGEFLYLRPRNAEIAYAVPIDGDLQPPQFQVGPVQVVDPDFSPGFRFGAGFTIGQCNAIVVTWSQLDSYTQDQFSLPGLGPVVRSLVSPSPPGLNVAADGLFARADLDTQFKLLDVDYKGLIAYCCDYQVAYVVGARYANLEQHFRSVFEELGVNNVRAESEFDGMGLKLGMEGERYGNCTRFYVYGKGYASLVGGTFRTRYQYDNQSQPLIVDTSWEAGRIVTILDLEFGLGWRNHCDNLRFSVGYLFSSWLNVVKTNEWINTVQNNNFVDPSDNFRGLMTFDGLTARAEFLW